MLTFLEFAALVAGCAAIVGPHSMPKVARAAGWATGAALRFLREGRAAATTFAKENKLPDLSHEMTKGLDGLHDIRGEWQQLTQPRRLVTYVMRSAADPGAPSTPAGTTATSSDGSAGGAGVGDGRANVGSSMTQSTAPAEAFSSAGSGSEQPVFRSGSVSAMSGTSANFKGGAGLLAHTLQAAAAVPSKTVSGNVSSTPARSPSSLSRDGHATVRNPPRWK